MADDPVGSASTRALTLGVEKDLLRTAAQQTVGLLERTGAGAPPWSGFLAVDRVQSVMVGTCGFKGPPASQRIVDIAYFTFPQFDGRGVAPSWAW